VVLAWPLGCNAARLCAEFRHSGRAANPAVVTELGKGPTEAKSPPRPEPGGREGAEDLRLLRHGVNALAVAFAFGGFNFEPELLAEFAEMNPRTLWACQFAAFISSAKLAPYGRLISSRIFAPFVPRRNPTPSWVALAAFFALGCLAGLGSALAGFLALGGLFLFITPVREEASQFGGKVWHRIR
jgi:hypothetical protein